MKRVLTFIAVLVLSCLLLNSQEDFFTAKRKSKITDKTKINFDFTKMNYNISSSLMFDMLVEPEKFANKTAKIRGQFHSDVFEGKRTFAILIWDATGCCPSGITVLPLEKANYPEDFPDSGYYTTITGTLELHNFTGEEMLYLVAEKWE